MEGGARQRLIDAAHAHLDEHGLEGLTLRAIARRAGVSHGAPLRHFPTVGHLLAAVAAEGFRSLHASVAATVAELPGEASALRRLQAGAHGYVRFAVADPGPFELMFRHERHAAQEPELLEAGAAAFLQLVELVTAAQAEGWRAEQPPGELAALVWAGVHGLVSLWLPGTLPAAVSLTGAEADLDRLLDLMIATVTAGPPAASPRTRSRRRSPR